MNEFWKACFLLIGLAIVTFVSGYMPTCVSNKKVLNLLAVFGGGILMGAALLVVLPESVGILVMLNFNSLEPPITEDKIFTVSMALTIGLSVTSGFIFMLVLDEAVNCC